MRCIGVILLACVCVAAQAAMVDAAIDTVEPFGYLSKPSTVLGVMAGPEGTQVTFDGAFYTGDAELCFFYGAPLKPVMVRQKRLLGGCLPVVTYGWREGDLAYSVEGFGATLDADPASNTINFIKVWVRNLGGRPATAHFAAALRYRADDHRCDRMTHESFSPTWTYEMTQTQAIRDGKLLMVFPEGAEREAVPGKAYKEPFKGADMHVSERAEVCVARYDLPLSPRSSTELTFKMPLTPVPLANAAEVTEIASADYDSYLGRTISFWEHELSRGVQIHLPEQKVQEAHRANLMYDLIAVDQEGENWVQKVNEFQYDHFWLRDGAYIIRTYDLLGHHETAERCLEYFLRFQRPDGLFSSQGGQLDGFGQALFALGQHYVMTGDLEWARRIYKHIPPAIQWLRQTRAKDEYHLMPQTHAHDNENIDGRYTGHNLWALLGVRMAAVLARATGHDDDAAAFIREYDDFRAAFMTRLEQVAGKDGYIPPGLDVQGGHDWGNLLGVYPSEVLEPQDPRVGTTLDKMHREKYSEGIMHYGSVLHHYVTTNVTQTHIVRGEQEKALTDFYHLLLHTGSTHEGFELGARPWGERDVGGNYPPHGWFAAKFNAVLRNMLVQERGGNGGLDQRDLHLFSVVSPEWSQPGERVAFDNAPTELGGISASMQFERDGALVQISNQFRREPRSIVLHVPYFVELQTFETDALRSRKVTATDTAIVLSPDVTRVMLKWRRNGAAHMSCQTVVDAYKTEYARRFAEYVAAGNKPLTIEAPRLLSDEEREQAYDSRWGPQAVGIAVHKPVRVSGGTEAPHAPERAVDGNAFDSDGSSWWAGPPTPRWLTVDLEEPFTIDRIQVVTYWDGSRYYQYTVEVSQDGEDWRQLVDMSKNTRPSTSRGDMHKLPPTKARFVRINLLHNSANPSVHLVELRVFQAE